MIESQDPIPISQTQSDPAESKPHKTLHKNESLSPEQSELDQDQNGAVCQDDVKKQKAKKNERTKHNAPDLKHKTQEKNSIGKPSGPQKRHVVSEAKEKI